MASLRHDPADLGRCAIAVTRILQHVLEKNGLPGAAASLVCGDIEASKAIVASGDVHMGGSHTVRLVQA